MTPTNYFLCKRSLALGFAALLTGCGNQSTSNTTPPPSVTVSLNKSSLSLQIDATTQFTATVKGTPNTAVSWAVNSKAGGDSSIGVVSATGLYTAPAKPGTYTVTATSMADSTKSASAQVTVQDPPPSVSISPGSSTLGVGLTQQFTATVQNVT